MTIINESGLYALIFGNKLETAKKFKHWVTSEVLPSIRKTGGYSMTENQKMIAETRMHNIRIRKAAILNKIAEDYSGTYKQVLSETFPWNTFGKHCWEAEKVIDILSNVETSTSIESVDQTTCDDYYIYTIGIDLVDRMDEKAYKTPSNLQSFHFVFWNDFNYIGYYHDDVGKPIKIDDKNVSNIFIVDNPDFIKSLC